MNYAIALDYQNCINCKACEVACKEQNGVELGAKKQRIWVGQTEETNSANELFINFYPSQCNQCLEAPCVDVCPTEASHIIDGGIVLVDPKKCILCKACMEACPYDARFVDDVKVAVDKCTFCYDTRISKGYDTTACQATCPTKVRLFGDLDDESGDLVQLLKKRKFFVLKQKEKTIPKLFYILPEKDANYAQQSIGKNITIYTWDEMKPIIDKAKAKRSKQWKKS